MANTWKEVNGENLVWVPGHYETKTSTDDTTRIGPLLSYPFSMKTTYTTSGVSGLSAYSTSPTSEKTNHATDPWFK